MEIAFFSDSYLPFRDGVAVEVHALARALKQLGHGVTVYAPEPIAGAPSREVEHEGIPIVRVRSLPVPIYGEYRWPLFPFPKVAGRNFGSEVDVVHAHTPGMLGTTALFAARRYRHPIVGTFHTDVYAARESFQSHKLLALFFWVARWYSLGLYYRCNVTTVPSVPARESLLAHATKPFRHPIEVVPNGIEVDRFRPGLSVPDWRARCGFSDGPLLTYLGRLTADKGIHRYLDALHTLPRDEPWAAIIAGVGPEETAVRARLASDPRLGERVRYIGPVAEEEKPALLSQTDLFVLPSVADTSSIAVLEAMASGAACVVSNIGGPSSIVQENRTGRIVPIDHPAPLRDTLTELIRAPDERLRLNRAGQRWVREEASIEASARRFVTLYRALMDHRAPATPVRAAR